MMTRSMSGEQVSVSAFESIVMKIMCAAFFCKFKLVWMR
jgi:hypothetical protein